MTENSFIIRNMSLDEFRLSVDWARQEGWNPGLSDAECYYAADPNGFFVGLLNDEPIATISAVKYDNSFGFLGFYIVKPEFRGQGYGIRIWNAAMDYLNGCNIALDGVVAQQENYKKSGFQYAYGNLRYEGVAKHVPFSKSGLTEISIIPFDELRDYDQGFFPASRDSFLKKWYTQTSSYGLAFRKTNTIRGYGLIRPCVSGYKVGPLYAEDVNVAQTLLSALVTHLAPGERFYLDVPQINQAALQLTETFKMNLSFETARMYTNAIPDLPVDKIFSVTSFEIG
ncbi:MAG: GNAT family N-acetyltransferase [Opitutales bacterium]